MKRADLQTNRIIKAVSKNALKETIVAAFFMPAIQLGWGMSQTLNLAYPLKIRLAAECFIVEDSAGQALAYVYFEDLESRRIAMRRLTKANALSIAQTTARALTDHIVGTGGESVR